ncbi:hypothetical protein A3A38_01780 [Candidatus Kaiserbacteria bacterium RIFCSPLOWO2_01_FULL_53_17]|uniref:SpoVT-AbrB domain-containing protein n=1 Tax=Candidatus Kaiserbacteria bacterium RIFCSPLOWO2_01_FULL_53_17 TaxID=1798511 RepID=A0A1F6EHV0_9BACT|nr:MAG: hypothetical protein A3A38_01780 [Candidatus Kaiserbacteria bacterium RIFCSPLOWO2_01_FULL_53_17]
MKTITTAQVRTTSVRKWGNGHGVLLPKAFVDTLGLAHAEVQTVLRGSSIVLTKKSPQNLLKNASRSKTSCAAYRGATSTSLLISACPRVVRYGSALRT